MKDSMDSLLLLNKTPLASTGAGGPPMKKIRRDKRLIDNPVTRDETGPPFLRKNVTSISLMKTSTLKQSSLGYV